ncbi:hypothetical protein DXG01_008720 [Tephrocybe rancida]|nr:hypothetical protein DXG01_008720 [Tephrocybe rancida]
MSDTNGSTPPSYPPTDDPGFMGAPEAMESDMEDEVDQLDSDSDTADTDADAQNGAGGQRILGQTLLPPLRLENIMSADGVTGNLALSKEGLFILSVATEEFIKRMAQAGHLRASAERRTTVNYSDMSDTTQQYQEFMFLNGKYILTLNAEESSYCCVIIETIPVPISLKDAVELRTAKEKELFDADPSAPLTTARPSTSASAPRKAKSRANGGAPPKHDRRSDKGLPRTSAPVDSDSTYSDWADTRPSRAGGKPAITLYNGRLSVSARPSPLANGHGTSTAPSRSGTLTPARSHEPIASSVASPQHQPSSAASPVPSQSEEKLAQTPYSGPASGFLQGPGGPFGRVAQNPGRTIYSQQYRAE